MKTTLGILQKTFNVGSCIYRSWSTIREPKGNTEVGQSM